LGWTTMATKAMLWPTPNRVSTQKPMAVKFSLSTFGRALPKASYRPPSWTLQTEHAVPISSKGIDSDDIATPPLGPEVSGEAKGYITFDVPRRTTLELFGSQDTTSKNPIPQWTLGEIPTAQPYPK
jgi:hypothetical protein